MASLLKRIMSAFRPSQPAYKPIRAPTPDHLFWSATRVRHFAQRITGNQKRRGTYDENIRLLNAVYSKLTGQKGTPQLFMQKVNPLLFGQMFGWHFHDTKKLIGSQWVVLYKMIVNSKCEHCRQMGAALHITN